MRSFLRMLETRKSSLPTVKHLFLYDNGQPVEESSEKDELNVVTSIISTVAHSLLTLFGSLESTHVTYDRVMPPGSHLPLLREISINVSVLIADREMGETAVDPPVLPNLRRLHAWGTFTRVEDILEVTAVARAAPKIEEIWLSGLSYAPAIAVALRAGFDLAPLEDDDELEGGVEIRFPDSLKRLICQVSVEKASRAWSTMSHRMDHLEMRYRLSELAKERENVVIAPQDNFAIDDCRDLWLDVVKEGEGCWEVYSRRRS